MEDDPLVMPRREAAGLLVEPLSPEGLSMEPVGVELVNNAVVEPDHRELHLRNDPVFVVSRISDDRSSVHGAAQIVLSQICGLWREVAATILDPCGRAVGPREELNIFEVAVGGVVKKRACFGPSPVDIIKVERWGALVGRLARFDYPRQAGGRVEGDIVIDELAKEDLSDGYGISPIRALPAVHRSPWSAEGPKHFKRREERRPVKKAPEPVAAHALVPVVTKGPHTSELAHAVMMCHV